MTPRVSVVVPTRNRLATLTRALAGVDAQRFRDFEILVVDDGSTDGTADWLRARYPGVRLLARASPAGAASARNLGLERARGKFVAFLDDDDVWQPSYLEAQVNHLDANPAAALSYADYVESDSFGRRSRPDNRTRLRNASPLLRLLAESFIHTLSVVVCRREAFDRFGRFDESLTIVHDLEWYARVLGGGGSVLHLQRALVDRSVPGGLLASHRHWFREERAVLAKALDGSPEHRKYERMVRAYRSLFFARVALTRRDLTFGLVRLVEAFLSSPRWTVQLATVRLLRRIPRDRRAGAWGAHAGVGR
ncbi:MAG: glycosyltransferase [Actinomycetota bacterium]|nr:glycosyltransferase [Actinomycetota bacterium]